MYYTLDHSGNVKQYPVSIGVARIDEKGESKKIIGDLRKFLKEKNIQLWSHQEIKWSNLRFPERVWLAKRILESRLAYSGIYITLSYFTKLRDYFVMRKTPSWHYRLFSIWYFKALEMIIEKQSDVHIDSFLQDNQRNITKEMNIIVSLLEKMLSINSLSSSVGMHDSKTDEGIQMADFIAGMISDMSKLRMEINDFKINVKIDPPIKKEIRTIESS